jgi:hypothetical protein
VWPTFLIPAALAVLSPLGLARDAGLAFSGTLIRVGRESISLRLADGVIVDARLRPASTGRPLRTGDQVQVTCKTIPRVWENDTSRFQFLEVASLLVLRGASPDAAPKTPEPPPLREGAIGFTPEARGRLEQAREVNLEYASHLPDFVADETARRYTAGAGPLEWRYVDTIQTEITFKGSQAVRQHIRKNGSPWNRPFRALPGFKWYGGFGTEIRPLFDKECPTTLKYEGHEEVGGKQLVKYRFLSSADGCFVSFYAEYQRYNPARTGQVFIDDSTGNVLQLDEDAIEFPVEFGFARRTEEAYWDYVRIGDAAHLLPVRAKFVVLMSSGTRWRVEVEYKNHRHFVSSANIRYQ